MKKNFHINKISVHSKITSCTLLSAGANRKGHCLIQWKLNYVFLTNAITKQQKVI